MASQEFGFNDVPTDIDLVEVGSYISGLSQFMTVCQTPMTIAIQGDWGTGKTSAMRALKRGLNNDEYWQVDFNTWQYAQFDLGDQLVFSLIGAILGNLNSRIPELKSDEKKSGNTLKKFITQTNKSIQRGLYAAARTAISTTVPYGEAIISGFDEIQKANAEARGTEETTDNFVEVDASIQLITDLRNNLQQIVQSIIQAKPETHGFQGPKRILIYIDDLDRLEPERAVAIMEAIKVFLDIQDCVFVLAIDFAVVLRGVREKYGHDFSEDKARAFFDKIIQVPFNLPVGAYNVAGLLETGLESIGVRVSKDEIDDFDVLAQTSAGRNPRSIKRLVNTFALIKIIGSSVLSDSDQNLTPDTARDIHIFSILCLQTAYPDVFTELTRPQSHEGRSDKWAEIKSATEQDTEEARTWREKFGINEYKEDAFAIFIDMVEQLFSTSPEKKFNSELFNDALIKSAVTAVGTTETAGATTQASHASAIQSLDTRYSTLLTTKPHAAELARLFEATMKDILGEIEAGDTGNYWSYKASGESNLPEVIKGKRFLELHYKQYGLNPKFGNYLTDEAGDKILADMEERFPDTPCSHSKKSTPRFSIREITTESQAIYAAELIAKAYLDSSNYSR